MSKLDLQTIHREALAYPSRHRTVTIATADRDGMPNISYAPYLALTGEFYIYVSDTVLRTRNLMDTGRASVLFADTERECQNLFARRRLSLECQVVEVPYGSDHYQLVIDCFHESFGSHFRPLTELSDFHLFQLHPVRGLYVKGFGLAYALEGENLGQIRHLTGNGHQRREKIVPPSDGVVR